MKWTVRGREYDFKPVTMRLRADVNKLAEKDGKIDYTLIENDGEVLNKFMRLILDGDHTGVDWFDLLDEEVQPIVADFFTQSKLRIQKWSDSLLNFYTTPENTTTTERQSQGDTQ